MLTCDESLPDQVRFLRRKAVVRWTSTRIPFPRNRRISIHGLPCRHKVAIATTYQYLHPRRFTPTDHSASDCKAACLTQRQCVCTSVLAGADAKRRGYASDVRDFATWGNGIPASGDSVAEPKWAKVLQRAKVSQDLHSSRLAPHIASA